MTPRLGIVCLMLATIIPAAESQANTPATSVDGHTATVGPAVQVVFGSFQNAANARSWAAKVARSLDIQTELQSVAGAQAQMHRVVSHGLEANAAAQLSHTARRAGMQVWSRHVEKVEAGSTRRVAPTTDLDWHVGMQSRGFRQDGRDGQVRSHWSGSFSAYWQRRWDDERILLTVEPFLRIDSQDSERTHFDLREFYGSYIGRRWEVHAGLRRVFWGVTEFHHLVDVVNQTDLVENIDAEDKLGQPVLQVSVQRDWGVLDLMLLPGFRERTFPGRDGRLRPLLEVASSAQYESGAQEHRVDAALRYAHQVGDLEFGLYHFSGTNRDPVLLPEARLNGALWLRPFYSVIDQTGVDAQWISGDWAYKLEAITRSGDGDRYGAYVAGVERTLVGVLGTRADLGVVLEYMHDSRGHAAHNTVFERDIALGLRLAPNDHAATNALFGVIYDTQTHEYLVSLEGSRRIGDHWLLQLEMRFFAGAEDEGDSIALLFDTQNKTAALQRDDILQLEFTRYF